MKNVITFSLLFKVDLSDSENELEEDGVDGDTGGGAGRTDPTAAGGALAGYDIFKIRDILYQGLLLMIHRIDI